MCVLCVCVWVCGCVGVRVCVGRQGAAVQGDGVERAGSAVYIYIYIYIYIPGGRAPPCKATGWSGQGSAGKAVSARPGAAPAATSILNAVAKEQV